MNEHPSKFFTKLFERSCNGSFYEELQGDLEERFYMNLEEKGIKRAQNFIAFAMIAIALLGQLGMALYNAQTRIKEISVRKVLGAKFKTIITLLLKGTLISLIITIAISTPMAYPISEDMKQNTPKLIFEPSIYEYGRAILELSTLVVMVVVLQTRKVARLNPAETLKR